MFLYLYSWLISLNLQKISISQKRINMNFLERRMQISDFVWTNFLHIILTINWSETPPALCMHNNWIIIIFCLKYIARA